MNNTLRLDASQALDLATAAALLDQGRLVAVPTETVYGLAADARQPSAVEQIFRAKQRPADHPLIVHIDSVNALAHWVSNVPEAAFKLADAFWPGPLTMVLPKAASVSPLVTGGLDYIAVRVPSHPVLLQLLRTLKTGLAAPSANLYQQLSPTCAEHVLKQLNGRIDAVLDGGRCTLGLESTIIDLTTTTPRILRPGPISRDAIESVLGHAVDAPLRHNKKVSGNDAIHYRPRAHLNIVSATRFAQLIADPHYAADVAFVAHDVTLFKAITSTAITSLLASDKTAYAAALYHTLHQLDEVGVQTIFWLCPPQTAAWHDVNDRLRRAGIWLE